MKARLLANFNWLAFDSLLRLAGGMLVGVWVARYLGPAQFGLLSYALAFVALFANVAKLGMDRVMVRELIRLPEREGEILGTIFVLKLAVSVLALVAVIASAWVTREGDVEFVFLVAVIAAGMLVNALDAFDVYYQAHLLSRHLVVARGVSFICFSLLRIALIMGGYPVIYFAAASTLDIALGGAIMLWTYRRVHPVKLLWRFDGQILQRLLKDGWPLIATSVLIIMHTRIDQVMLGEMMGNTEVGIYSAAVRLSDVWLFVPMLIVQTLNPYLIRLREHSPALYHARLIQLYSIMFWLGVLVGVMTWLFGEFFTILLFGEDFRAAYLPLLLIVWTGIFKSQAVAASIWMIGENIQIYRLLLNLLAVPLNIALNYGLIPVYGVPGAALASLISIGVSTWLLPFLFEPMRQSNRDFFRSIDPRCLLLSKA